MTTRTFVVRALFGFALICSCPGSPCWAQEMPQQQADRLEAEASADRQQAAAAHERARAAEELAQQARDQAAKATDPVVRTSWQRTVTEREETARRLKEQADELDQATAKKVAEAARLRAEAGTSPAPSGPPPVPGGQPPVPTGPPSPPVPVADGEPAKLGAVGCAATEIALPIDEIAGKWRSDDGKESVEISAKAGDTAKFVLKGRFEWEGSYDGAKLTFTRTPKVNEMGEVAPGWAREKVAGTLQWSLEFEAKRKCGVARLEGHWFPGVIKFLEEKDATGHTIKQDASVAGKGKPVDVEYMRDAPAIANAFVLEQQTGFTAAGRPKKPYPFQASVSPDFAEPIRTLFVYGFDLPKANFQIMSEDPAIDYSVIAVSKRLFDSPENLADPQKALFVKGWNQVMAPLDADTALIAKDMDSALVQAHLRPRALLPGIKHFALNGLDGSWRLRFGDDRTTITFAREITEKIYDPTTSLLLPERFLVEVRTDGDFPLDEIPVKLQLNKAPITWNGKPTLVARKVPRDPAIDRLRKDKGENPLPTIYRTDLIELVEKDRRGTELGVYYLKAAVGDKLWGALQDQSLLGAPPDISAPILLNPDVLGMTWKDALTRAARANGVAIEDWKKLSGADATQISNLIVTKPSAATLAKTVAKSLVPLLPISTSPDDFTVHVRITVGDQAALLLFRDEFVNEMKAAIKSLDQVSSDETLRGWRQSIGRELWEDGSPWQDLEVTCPKGDKCALYKTFDPDFLEKEFGANLAAAEKWSLQAVREGLGEYKKKVAEAIATAEGTSDSDVEKLVRLIGHGYEPLLPGVVPRMMRLVDINSKNEVINDFVRDRVEQAKRDRAEQGKADDPSVIQDLYPVRRLWIPELNGRYTLWNLHTLAEEVQTQKDFSKADTAVGLAIVGLVSVPLLAGEGFIAACLAAAEPTASVIQAGVAEIPDFLEKREDVRFALGAHLVLGGDRLAEALLKETKWYEVFFAIAPQALSFVIATAELGPTLKAAASEAFLAARQGAAWVRGARVMSRVKAGGGAAFKLLSEADQAAVIRQMAEAKLMQEYGQGTSLNSAQRSANEAADVLIDEAKPGPSTPKLTPEPAIDAPGEPGPRPTHEPEFVPLTPERTPNYSPSDFPEVRPRFPQGMPAEEQATLVQNGPYANTEWKTTFTGKDGRIQRRTFTLERQIGAESVNSRNFRLVNPGIEGCEIGCIIKTVEPGNVGAAADAVEGYNNLLKGVGDDVLQPKLIHAQLDAPRPYIIVEELRPVPGELVIFDPNKWPEVLASFAADPGLGDALFEASARIQEAGFSWFDGHIGNWYFKKVNGKWKAGVLDPDGIVPFGKANRRVGKLTAWNEILSFEHCGSLSNSKERLRLIVQNDWAERRFGRSFDQLSEEEQRGWSIDAASTTHPAEYFMDLETHTEKMMELHQFFETNPTTGERTGKLIDPGRPLDLGKWGRISPKMFRPERLQPIEASTGGFWQNP